MQQPKSQPTKHDPFANLTGLGSSLPTPTQPAPKVQPSQQPRATSPYGQQGSSYNGVSSGGAWGATFQTRQQPMQGGGGWNPNGMQSYEPKSK